MKKLNNIKKFNKNIIILSVGLALSACGSEKLNEFKPVEPTPTPTPAPAVNNPPSITSTSVDTATVGVAYSYTLTATDADEADTLTMSVTTTLPDWLTFDVASGALSGTPSEAGDHDIVLAVSDGNDDVTQPFTITVTEAIAGPETALVVYEDIDNPDWSLWGDSGATTSIIEDADTDYGQVANFVINGSTVAGFNNRDSGAEPFAIPEGILTLEFDLKMIALPTAGATDWMVKLEGTGAKEADFTTSVEGVAPVLDTWMHYTFNVANFDVTDINLVMIFPKWGTGDGAEYSIDNVTFNVTPDDGTRTPGDSGDGATTTDTQGIDFEGSQLTWGSFDTAKVQYIDNPDMTGTNTSSTVALLDILKGDGDWAGARTEGIATFTLDATNCVVKLDVNRDTIGVMHVKFEKQNGDGFGSAGTVTATNTVVNEWETLTFNTCDWIGNPETDVIDGFAIHADQTANRSQDIMVHFDNIMFTAQGDVAPADGPTEGAPVPTAADADVIAVFSDTYTAVADVITDPDWGQGTDTTVIDVAGNNTLKMAGLDYQGIQFATQDVSGKTSLHLDYWTADATTFDVFLISAGPLETAYTITTTTGGWQSVDIPLSAFSDVVNLADVFQLKFVGSGTIYLDNMMFTAESDVAPADGPTEGAPVPTAADADVISVFSDTYTAVADVITDPDWGQGTDTTVIDVAGNNTLKMAGLDYQGIQFATQDVSGKSFLHVDYWTADATTFDVFLISAGPLETAYTITTTTGGWQSVHIPLSAFSDVVNLADVFQFKFVGGGTIFVDNLHFH